MTMHLDVRVSTTKTTKPKKVKLTKNQLASIAEDHRKYNKALKQAGRHSERLTLEEYIAYRQGTYKPKTKAKEFKEYVAPEGNYRRETREVKSLNSGAQVAPAPAKKEYTGTLVKGIATMHKSNAVPIISQEEAIEVATMRRN